MKSFVLCVFLLMTFGYFCDSDTKSPIPYVSIGVEGKNAGTVSDAQGRFVLELGNKVEPLDCVTISHISYNSMRFCIKDVLSSPRTFILTPAQVIIENIVVDNREKREKKLGRDNVGLGIVSYNFYTTGNIKRSDRLSVEVGTLFKIKGDSRVNSANFHVNGNNFNRVKFRLSVYSVENELPYELLNNQDIIIELKDKYRGWYKVDLRPYDIYISGHDKIVVTLTLLEDAVDSDRTWFTITAAMLPGNVIIRREKAMDSWQSSGGTALSFYLETTQYE